MKKFCYTFFLYWCILFINNQVYAEKVDWTECDVIRKDSTGDICHKDGKIIPTNKMIVKENLFLILKISCGKNNAGTNSWSDYFHAMTTPYTLQGSRYWTSSSEKNKGHIGQNIFTGSRTAKGLLILGKGKWLKKKNQWDFLFKSEGNLSMKEHLSKGVEGHEGKDEWRRKCEIKLEKSIPIKTAMRAGLLIKNSSKLKEKIDSLQKIVESSKVNDLELQNEVESLIVSLEEEKQKFIDQKNKNDHLEKQKLELTEDNKKLYTQVESQISSQAYDNIININKTLKSETKSLKQKIKIAANQILKTNSDLDKLKLENKNLREEIKIAENQILKTNSDLDKLKLENKNIREEIKIAETSVNKLESEISKVQEDLNEEELKEQEIDTLVKKLSKKQLKDESQDTSNSIEIKFSLLEARKEVGDGFTNYIASKNFTLLPSNICIMNLLEKKINFDNNEQIGIFIDGYKPFFYSVDATNAFSEQYNIEFDVPSSIDANSDQCFPLVFEVPMVFKERDIILFMSKNDEIIESTTIQ